MSGVHTVSTMKPDDLDDHVHPPVDPPVDPRVHTADRRRSPRATTRKLTAITLPNDGGRMAACITNFSATGVGLVVTRELAPGQRFHLDLHDAGGRTTLLYAVVRCDPCNNCYRVGGVLLEVAPAAANRRVGTSRLQRAVEQLRKATGS